jgi:hypothetical protein
VFDGDIAGGDRLIRLGRVIKRPGLHGRRFQCAAFESEAKLIEDRGNLDARQLGRVDTDQALAVVVEIDEIELDAPRADACDRDMAAIEPPLSTSSLARTPARRRCLARG